VPVSIGSDGNSCCTSISELSPWKLHGTEGREREREREGAEGAEYWRRRSSRKHNLKAVDHPAPPRTFLNTRGRAPRTDNSARYLETARPIDLRPSDRQGGKRVGTADGGGYIDCQGLRIRVSRERHLLPLSLLPLLPQHSSKEERERERERESTRFAAKVPSSRRDGERPRRDLSGHAGRISRSPRVEGGVFAPSFAPFLLRPSVLRWLLHSRVLPAGIFRQPHR